MAVNVTGGALEFDAFINMNGFEASIRRMEEGIRRLTQTANNEASAIENVASKAATALGAYLSINAAEGFVSKLVQVRGEFEQLGVAFKVMLGNKEQADALMAQAVQLAATTPFKLSEVASGAKQLLAYGTAAEDITGTLKMLGNVAAGVGAPLNDIVYLYGTLQTQGRAYTRDILQFTTRGIPIVGELAKQFGVTTAEVQKMVEAGKVGFPQIQQAFQYMTGEGGKFFNLMEAQSHTVTGMLSNLGDAFDIMLNDIGQSNEGLIKGSIEGLTTLVQNYQTVIDIIKVLIATYGTYKAAIITTTAVTTIAEEVTAGFTAVEILRYRATLLTQGAMKLLNATMLSNPYVAVATGIAALVGAYLALHKETDNTINSQKLLADAQKNIADNTAGLEAKIRPYVSALKNANISEKERLDIYNKLKAIDPQIVAGLNAQTLSYDALTKNVNSYLTALRGKIELERNDNAIQGSVNAEDDLRQRISDLNRKIFALDDANIRLKKNTDEYSKAQVSANNAIKANLKGQIADLDTQLGKQKEVTQGLGFARAGLVDNSNKTIDAQKRTVEVIDGDIKKLKEQQVALSDTSAEWKNYQKQIEALQKEREGITGATKQELNAQQSEESKINTILHERQGLLDKLASLQRDSKQSGMVQDDSEVDKIREKYDDAFKAIEDYNKKIADFNKKNGTSLKGIGLEDIDKLKNTEATEIANTIYKQDSANYIAALDDKKKAFDDFEKIVQDGNDEQTAYAKQAYQSQIGDFNSYLDYLKSQQDDLKFKVSVEPNNVGLQQSLLAVNKAITAEENKQSATRLEQQIADYKRLFDATATYNVKRKQIDTQYYKDVGLLARQYSGKELSDRILILKDQRQASIDAAKDEVFQKSELYQKLNTDIVQMSRQQIKSQVEAIKTVLSKGVEIPPNLKQELQAQLDSLQKSLHYSGNTNFVNQLKAQKQAAEEALASGKLSTEEYKKQLALIEKINGELKDQTAKTLQDISNGAGEISGAFSNLASSLQPFDEGLSDTLQTVSDIAGVLGNAAGAAASFASGDIVGGVTKTINAIAGIFAIGAKSRESERKAQAELKTYQDSLIKGEVTYNELMRDRLRTQGDITKMTAAELQTRQQMLNLQKQQALADYNKLLAQIQNAGSQITGEHTEKTGGFLGIGKKTKTVQELAGLSDTDYATLEKLFTEGKLDDATSKWFQELKKVHDELDSIGETADQLKDQLNQILTGTTSDAISSSIKDGFANGYDSAADFANNLQDLFRNAILSAFEANQIKPAMQKFYDDLAQFNSDGLLDQNEIDQLTKVYNTTVDSLAQQYDQIKQIANLPGANDTANSLQGVLKGMTEQTGELLAGQFGAQRLTLVEILNIATQQLNQLNAIANNTYYLLSVDSRLRDLQTNGIKIK